jgi:hypothetical protein
MIYLLDFHLFVYHIKLKKAEKKRHVPKVIVPAIGSCSKDAGKSPDPAGKHGKYLEYGSSFPAWNFPMISGRILPERNGICRNLPKKIRKIPGRNTASNFLVFSVASRRFPAVHRSPG